MKKKFKINLEEVKNSFVASGNNLFDFVLSYNFLRVVSFEERITLYCQLVSQYESVFKVTDEFNTQSDIEFALVYPQ